MSSADQDIVQEARERYDIATEAMSANHARMKEDMEFSNPADPKQWTDAQRQVRAQRPILTLDQTNQYINQVVNDGRQNSPSIQVMPVDSKGDVKVAEKYNGLIRHIEYVSRAPVAYDTGLELSARVGLGWLRVFPCVMNEETGEQELRIGRVVSYLDCRLDPDDTEADGSGAMYGFHEWSVSKKRHMKKYPDANPDGWQGSEGSTAWVTGEQTRVAEYQKVVEERVGKKNLRVWYPGKDDEPEAELLMPEEEYNLLSASERPKIIQSLQRMKRSVKSYITDGCDILEETTFPSKWLGIVPVYGHELWIDGKRFLCGMTRRMMDGQRFHNWQMSALAENNLQQPKAPFMVPSEAIEGHEEHWKALNTGNPSYLPFNSLDGEGNALPFRPERIGSPQFPIAFANGARLGSEEMQASLGMYKSNLGMASSSVSGRAKAQDKMEGDTANFHYIDNWRRALEQVGRIIVDAAPVVYDTKRTLRILGQDGDSSFVEVDPDLKKAAKVDAKGRVQAINLGFGTYDVRVKAGPGYTTVRAELTDRLTQMGQTNPQLAAALTPLLAEMADIPNADRVARIALALLPPQVQKAYEDPEGAPDIPPAVMAQIEQQGAQLQQATQIIEQLTQELQQAQSGEAVKMQEAQASLQISQGDLQVKQGELQIKAQDSQTRQFQAETQRMQLQLDAQRAQAEDLRTAQEAAQAAMERQTAGQEQAAQIAEVMQTVQVVAEQTTEQVAALGEQQAALAETVAALASTVTAPRVVQVQRGPDGRIVGAVAVTSQEPTEVTQ